MSPDQPYPGLVAELGFWFEVETAEEVKGWFDVGPQHMQPAGVVHGGVYASFAEAIASIGTMASAPGKVVLGMSNATSFLRPVSKGKVHGTGVPRHSGRTTSVWDIDMTGDDGKLCAVSRVTLAIR